MTTAAHSILASLADQGLRLRLPNDGDRILVSPSDKVTAEVRAIVAENRDTLKIALRESQTSASAGGGKDSTAIPVALQRPGKRECAHNGDVADGLFRFHEIGAHAEVVDGRDVDAARVVAETAIGATMAQLAAEQITKWQSKVDALPPPADASLSILNREMRHYLGESWLANAIAAGWNDASLFALPRTAPLHHPNAAGVLIGLALSPHGRRGRDGRWHRCEVVKVTPAAILHRTPGGAVFRTWRIQPERYDQPIVWEHPAFVPHRQQIAA